MVMISIADLILTSHWFLSALFSSHGPFHNADYRVKENSLFCIANSWISVTAGTWSVLYNCMFCLFMIF